MNARDVRAQGGNTRAILEPEDNTNIMPGWREPDFCLSNHGEGGRPTANWDGDAHDDGHYLLSIDAEAAVKRCPSRLFIKLQKGDVVNCLKRLISERFDSTKMLNLVEKEDLGFTKTTYQRAPVSCETLLTALNLNQSTWLKTKSVFF